jgi:hypothetical protein
MTVGENGGRHVEWRQLLEIMCVHSFSDLTFITKDLSVETQQLLVSCDNMYSAF